MSLIGVVDLHLYAPSVLLVKHFAPAICIKGTRSDCFIVQSVLMILGGTDEFSMDLCMPQTRIVSHIRVNLEQSPLTVYSTAHAQNGFDALT